MISQVVTTLDGDTLRIRSTRIAGADATFDLAGALLSRGDKLTDELLARWQSEVEEEIAFKVGERVREREAADLARFRKTVFPFAIKAQFAGRCDVTGRQYPKNTWIAKTDDGWVIADETTDAALQAGTGYRADYLTRQMDREDSRF